MAYHQKNEMFPRMKKNILLVDLNDYFTSIIKKVG